MRRTIAIVLLMVTACSGGEGKVMTGRVVAVDGDLERVESFTMISGEESLTFTPAAGVRAEFPLSHLRDHLRTGDPVTVTYVETDAGPTAIVVGDG